MMLISILFQKSQHTKSWNRRDPARDLPSKHPLKAPIKQGPKWVKAWVFCHFEKKWYFVSLIWLDEPIRAKFGKNIESIDMKQNKS